jgi:hypothetical protein
MTTIINRASATFHVEVDGKDYQVTHARWNASRWQAAGEHWRVLSRVGIHGAAHECDPAKPTFKRVIAAVQAAGFGACAPTPQPEAV